MNRIITSIIVTLVATITMLAQDNTVGLLSYEPVNSFDGYNLIYPHNQPDVILLDNCGEVVHRWEGAIDERTANTAYLMEDGNLLLANRPADFSGDAFWAPGGGANIQLKDWDNNLLWEFTINNESARLHHDIAPVVRNGKLTVLAIVWERLSIEEAAAMGRDTTVREIDEIWPDYIIEVDPETDEIIWEWHAWDHLVQDFDETKPNFGVIADNPNRINVNLDLDGLGDPDWMHCNAIDYDDLRDQILLSVPNFHEVWIIDHSTTTEEAASSIGGLGGRGGDLMYRWGNPASYDAGTADDQTLFFQHDAHFIDEHLSPVDPNYGKIAVFNNQVGEDYSTVNIFNPQWDMYSMSYPFSQGVYMPNEFDLTREHPEDRTMMFSTGLSSVQLLPNTNLLVCVGRFGYSFEMTQDGDIVWEYRTPLIMGQAATQGAELSINNNLTFRMDRYPLDFPAFDGRDLESQGWIELEPNEEFCQTILPTNEIDFDYNLQVYPNPADGMLAVEWEESMFINIEIYDMMGRLQHRELDANGGMMYFDISELINGTYTVVVNGEDQVRFVVQH